MSHHRALITYLKPFQPFFDMDGVNEICINRPYELWVEKQGQFQRFEVPMLSIDFLMQWANLVAEYNQREISPDYPTLSSILPDGSRVQFVIEPACAKGSFIASIRRQTVLSLPLEQYFQKNSIHKKQNYSDNSYLLKEYQSENYIEFLRLAVLFRKNIIISGGTSTGKTTFLNTLLQSVPNNERIITIETDREVLSHHPNTVHLLAAEEGRRVTQITMLDLLKASLRLRPDRLLVSELRAEEAFSYLRAINSGHPGSLTTMHADKPSSCFDQLAFMALQSGVTFSRQELIQYAQSIINIIVQIKRDSFGKRYIDEIYFDAANTIQQEISA